MEGWGRDCCRDYLPPQLVVTHPTCPGPDEGWVGQEGDRIHGVSGEVCAHGAEYDKQERLRGAGDAEGGLRWAEGGIRDPGVQAPKPNPLSPPKSGSPAHLVSNEHRPDVEAGILALRDPVLVHFHQPADTLEQLDLIKTLDRIPTSQPPPPPLPPHLPQPASLEPARAPHRQAEAQGRAQHPVHVEPGAEEAHALVAAFERLHALEELRGRAGGGRSSNPTSGNP